MIQKRSQGEKLLIFSNHTKEKYPVICQKSSFSCGPLATSLFKNLNSSVYLQGMVFVFFLKKNPNFSTTLLFPEPKYDLVSGVQSTCCFVCLFLITYLLSKKHVKIKKMKECHVLLCLIQEEGKGKKSASCPNYQSTFAFSDFRVCIILSGECNFLPPAVS